MIEVNGKIKFVNSDERGDSLVLEDDTRIYLEKGGAKKFFGKKGGLLSGEAEPKTSKAGNNYLISTADKLEAEGGISSAVTPKSNVDFNTRAARGQALNLAMSIAIAEGKQHDHEHILSMIPKLLELSNKVQEGPAVIAEVPKSSEISADAF